ncbi:MAG: NUDIX domain-containing protein [Bacteroides sp.]|nr:NUDIX domain-containing protein [Bacteroides sp.]
MKKDYLDLLPYSTESIHPGFSVDCVILSFHKKKIQVLLNKFNVSDLWQLPGGFMLKKESADEAAYRVLHAWTGLTNIYLKQFHLFSDPNRTKMDQNELLSTYGQGGSWLMQRFVSLGYYALVRYEEVELSKVEGKSSKWYDIHHLPPLYSDHEDIIKTALKMIRALAQLLPIGQELLPEKFTLSELRKIYEILLDKAYDRRNFQRKMIASGYIVQLDETKNSSTYNPAALYAFDEKKKESIDYRIFL